MDTSSPISSFISSMRAGMFIALGCLLYLHIADKTIAAFLFSLGLLSVGLTGSLLYTGQVHKLVEPTPRRRARELPVIWAGNIAGVLITFFVAVLLSPQVWEGALAMAQKKLAVPPQTVFLQAVLCGILMTMATRVSSPKYVTIGCVAAFILAGFNHCIADSFYFASCLPESIPYLLLITAGNTVGGLLPVLGLEKKG